MGLRERQVLPTGGAAGRRIVVVLNERERETPRHFLQRRAAPTGTLRKDRPRVIAPRAERLTAQCALAKWVSEVCAQRKILICLRLLLFEELSPLESLI